MKSVRFHCSICNVKLEIDEECAGGTVQCPVCKNNIMIPIPGLHAGMELGNFTLSRYLGCGSLGEVWQAKESPLERLVALKILPDALTANPDVFKAFKNGMEEIIELEHPNLCRVFNLHENNGIHFLEGAYLDGVTLKQNMLYKGVCPEERVLKIIRVIVNVLQYVFEETGLLHLDIKPSNIMLVEGGKPVLTDLGIVSSLQSEFRTEHSDVMFTTPYYMSPEQVLEESDIDHRSDIYSLGATLFHLVTGEVPFDADDLVGILALHLSSPIPDASEVNPDVSARCAKLIKNMMAKDRKCRYNCWDDLLRDLDSVIEGGFPVTINIKNEEYCDVSTATSKILLRYSFLEENGTKVAKVCDGFEKENLPNFYDYTHLQESPTTLEQHEQKKPEKLSLAPPELRNKKTTIRPAKKTLLDKKRKNYKSTEKVDSYVYENELRQTKNTLKLFIILFVATLVIALVAIFFAINNHDEVVVLTNIKEEMNRALVKNEHILRIIRKGDMCLNVYDRKRAYLSDIPNIETLNGLELLVMQTNAYYQKYKKDGDNIDGKTLNLTIKRYEVLLNYIPKSSLLWKKVNAELKRLKGIKRLQLL